MKSSTVCTSALALMILLTASPASARRHRLRPGESPNLALQITVEPGMKAEVEAVDRNEGVSLSCEAECRADFAPGLYRLTLVHDGERDAMEYRLADPTQFTGNAADYTLKYVGLTSVILGLGIAAAGVGLVLLDVFPRIGPHSPRHPGPVEPRFWYGLAAIPVGAALGIVGLVLFGNNRRPFFVDRLRASRVRVDVLTSSTGVAGQLTAQF